MSERVKFTLRTGTHRLGEDQDAGERVSRLLTAARDGGAFVSLSSAGDGDLLDSEGG